MCSSPPRVGLRDLLEEPQELLVPVPRVAGVGDLAGGDLQCGEQRGGAVADVVVGGLLRQPGPHRQDRRSPVQGLDLGLLVDREHHRLLRRVQVQPDDVADLGLQLRVGGELERLAPPRLQAPLSPDPGHPHVGDAQLAASSRLDQCVTPSFCGGGSSVASTTATSSICAGRPASAGPPGQRPLGRSASSTRSPSAWTPRPAPRSHSSQPPRRPTARSAPAAPAPPALTAFASTGSSARSSSGICTATVNDIHHPTAG